MCALCFPHPQSARKAPQSSSRLECLGGNQDDQAGGASCWRQKDGPVDDASNPSDHQLFHLGRAPSWRLMLLRAQSILEGGSGRRRRVILVAEPAQCGLVTNFTPMPYREGKLLPSSLCAFVLLD